MVTRGMKMVKKASLLILITLLISIVPAPAFADRGQARQVVIVIDRLRIDDLSMMPNLIRLQRQGAIGLMNTNTAGAKEPSNTYITIANGQRSIGGAWAGRFYGTSEYVYDNVGVKSGKQMAGDLYYSLTGWKAGSTGIINPGIVDIINRNQDLQYDVQVGALGEQLKMAGILRVVIGNADTSVPRRYGAELVMDHRGFIPAGTVDNSINESDSEFPNGFRTNYDLVLTRAAESLKSGRMLLVIDLGDLSRLEESRALITKARFKEVREKSIKRIDGFIGRLMPRLDLNKDQVMVIVPTPANEDMQNQNTVTPVIMTGSGFKGEGLLTSPSTRRAGLIANTDVAPTVLAFYGIDKPIYMVGRPAAGLASSDSLAYLKELNQKFVLTYVQRPFLITATAAVEIIIVVISLLAIRFTSKRSWHLWMQRFTLAFLILPLDMLLYKYFQSASLARTVIEMTAFAAAAVFILEQVKLKTAGKLAVIGGLTSVTIIIDVLTGANLIMSSPLGYDPMLGARYYGIGNEFAGILMGSTLMAMASLLQDKYTGGPRGRWNLALAVYSLGVVIVFFAPGLGAETGGTITAVASFAYLLVLTNDRRMTPQLAGSLVLGIGLLLTGGALLDQRLNGGAESHIGLAMGQLIKGGWREAWYIIIRKLSLNWRLIRYSVWSGILLAVIAGLTILIYYPKGIFKTLERQWRYIYKGIKTILIAAIVGFFVNDSGLVQAATTVIYIFFPLIYLTLAEKMRQFGA